MTKADYIRQTTGVSDLLKASLIIFSVNIILTLWFYFSPNLSPIHVRDDQAVDQDSYSSKISPFTEVIDTHEKRRPVKSAERLKPILYQEPPADSTPTTDPYAASLLEAAQQPDAARHVATVVVPAAQVPADLNPQ